MIEWSIAISVAAGMIGAIALAFGLRGRRVDDRPVCRNCRFDLTGVYTADADATARCPECGAGLGGDRAVRRGLRRRRPVLIGSGSALAVLALALAGGAIYVGASGFDVNTIKPVWWLRIEATSERIGVDEPAIAELTRRIEAGRLRDGAVDRLIDDALSAQRRRDEGAWRTQWGGLIEAALVAGKLDDARLERYVHDALTISFGGSMRLAPDGSVTMVLIGSGEGVALFETEDPLRMSLLYKPTGAAESRIVVRPVVERAWMNGESIETTPDERAELRVASGGVIGPEFAERRSIPLGEHTLRAEVRVRAYLAANRSAGARGSTPRLPPANMPQIAEFTKTIENPFVVRSPSRHDVELIVDDELEPEILSRLEVQELRIHTRSGGLRATLIHRFQPGTIPLVVDVLLRDQDREWHYGFTRVMPRAGHGLSITALPTDFDADRVDVILRPNAEFASRDVGPLTVTSIWGREIVFNDVPVIWVDGKPENLWSLDEEGKIR